MGQASASLMAFPAVKRPKGWRRYMPLALGLGLGLPLLGIAISALFTKVEPGKHKIVTQITLVAPPPPPPPPQPKPPEPEKVKEEVKIEQPKPEPKPEPSAPPPGPLGLDAKGSGPGDSFGLAGRPGGRDIIASSGSGGGLDMTLFGAGAARHIAQELARNPRLKNSIYRIEIRVWLSRDGRFEREEIVQGTGDLELDNLIREGLSEVGAIRQPVPENLPQPLRIRVTSSDA
jgi:protein TonB